MMAKRGQRKYLCFDCNAHTYIHWIELTRRGLPRCSACGSQRLEAVTREAHKEIAGRQQVVVAGGTASTTHPQQVHPRTKVT